MNVKDLLREDDAVSPVIGVILMVAITVILAAVIGTFVLGLGDQVQSSAPNANFQFEYTTVGVTGGGGGGSTADFTKLTVNHNGGQDVDESNVQVLVDGNVGYDVDESTGSTTETFSGSGTLSTGSSGEVLAYDTSGSGFGSALTVSGDNNYGTSNAGALTGDEDVRVVWTSPNGDSSNTIGSSTVPN